MAPSARAVGQDWRVHGVSLPGYSHLRDGVECQDAYRHAYVAGAGAYVMAVSDGAGSRPRAAEGATLAVGVAVDLLSSRLRPGVPRDAEQWRHLLSSTFEEIVARFRAATAHIGSDPREFAATLTAGVLAPPWLGVVSLGDGLVIARSEDDVEEDPFHLLCYGGGTGRYSNETVFLSSTTALSDYAVDCVHDSALSAVLLATDGIVPLAVRGSDGRRRPNSSFLGPLLATFEDERPDPTQVARFLLEDRISALSADDKTILMAVLR